MVDRSCSHYWQREYGLTLNAMNIGQSRSQHIMHYYKMTKTWLCKFVSGVFAIIKAGDK